MAQNDDKTRRLTAKQTKAVQALLTAPTVDEAAQEAGVARGTLYRWLKDDFFVKELNKAKRQMIDRHLLKLQRAVGTAIDTLTGICRDGKAPAGSRVAAAREILTSTLRALELDDLRAVTERLGLLESQNANSNPGQWPRRR